jgi:ABC-2 type transport system ATP-binding protein/lipopolysaccharide transport system ATP-binding protein
VSNSTPDEARTAEIVLSGISVSFPIYQGSSRSLKKDLLFRSSGGRLASDAHHRIVVEALRDVTLDIKAGDRVALVGSNGAGKTTLLRAMAGIYEPVAGSVRIRGHISPMFDIALGIDGEISGYDNIRMRGLILGLNRDQVEERMADIVEFTELGDFLELPVRTYSSGMMMRLTFAVSTCFAPEILLMDEWIVAGDAAFMLKAQERIRSFVSKASIMVLASHRPDVCLEWCNKAVWMDKGAVLAVGEVAEILDAYYAASGALPRT